MSTRYDIRYVKRQELDTARWDRCISSATNTIIYGFHFYLDYMAAGQWDALVLGDYEAVMPLTWRRKYGISYLYQPPFTQQAGIFAVHSPTTTGPSLAVRSPITTGPSALRPDLIEAFLQNARQHFRFAEIFLNYGSPHPSLQPHSNFILPLDPPYEKLAANYKKDLQRNLKLAARSQLHYTSDLDLPTALEGYHRQYAARTPHVGPADYKNFEALCRHLDTRGQLVLRAVKSPTAAPGETHAAHSGGQILATALLLRDTHRLYLLQSTTPPAGRNTEANHFLLDRLIKEFAGSPLTLDFEGSDLPGIAHFYKNFGSVDQPYYFYRHNRLPWFVNLFKSLINHTLGRKH